MSSGKRRNYPKIDWVAVGRRLRELRGLEMTQADLAERIGVSQGFLSHAERGEKEIGAATLLAISHQFGISIEQLLTGRTQRGSN